VIALIFWRCDAIWIDIGHEFSVADMPWAATGRDFSRADTLLMAIDPLFSLADADFLLADADLAGIYMLWKRIVALSKCAVAVWKPADTHSREGLRSKYKERSNCENSERSGRGSGADKLLTPQFVVCYLASNYYALPQVRLA